MTTSPDPGLFVDCADTPFPLEIAQLAARFDAAIAAGDLETAQTLNGQIADLIAAQPAVSAVTVRELEADELAALQELQAAAAQQAEEAVGVAWVELRMIRDRWLAQTDYLDLYLANPSSFTLPTAIATAISDNAAAWQTWRQALRDLPANVTDPVAAVAAAVAIHVTSDTFDEPWPQPPAAPVIHLT